MSLHGIRAGHESTATLRRAKRRMRLDTVIGMVFSNGIAFFVMLMGAVVLHAGGVQLRHERRYGVAKLIFLRYSR